MKIRLMALSDQLYFDLYVKSLSRQDIPTPAEYFSLMIYKEEDLEKHRD